MSVKSGGLEPLKLFKVFRSIFERDLSGVLTLRRGSNEKRAWLLNGQVIRAVSNLPGESLLRALVVEGLISSTEQAELRAQLAEGGTTAEALLLEQRLVAPRRLQNVQRRLDRKIMVEAFTWPDGAFSFEEKRLRHDPKQKPLPSVPLLIEAVATGLPDAYCQAFVKRYGRQLVRATDRDRTEGESFDRFFPRPNIRDRLTTPAGFADLARFVGDPNATARQVCALVIAGLANYFNPHQAAAAPISPQSSQEVRITRARGSIAPPPRVPDASVEQPDPSVSATRTAPPSAPPRATPSTPPRAAPARPPRPPRPSGTPPPRRSAPRGPSVSGEESRPGLHRSGPIPKGARRAVGVQSGRPVAMRGEPRTSSRAATAQRTPPRPGSVGASESATPAPVAARGTGPQRAITGPNPAVTSSPAGVARAPSAPPPQRPRVSEPPAAQSAVAAARGQRPPPAPQGTPRSAPRRPASAPPRRPSTAKTSTRTGPSSPLELPEKIRAKLKEALDFARDLDGKDHYQVLDVARDADAKAVRTAFRGLARDFHVDKFQRYNLPKAQIGAVQKVFIAINRAHEVLSDPAQRKEYDAELEMKARGASVGADGASQIDQMFKAEKLVKEGALLIKNNKFDAAVDKFDEALAITPDDPVGNAGRVFAEYMVVRAHGGSPTVTLRARERLEEITGEYAPGQGREEPFLYLGRLYRFEEEPQLAITAFKRALEVNPHCAEAGSELRHAQRLTGQAQPDKKGGLGLFGRRKK